jgi:hypothetical protein
VDTQHCKTQCKITHKRHLPCGARLQEDRGKRKEEKRRGDPSAEKNLAATTALFFRRMAWITLMWLRRAGKLLFILLPRFVGVLWMFAFIKLIHEYLLL